MLFALRGVYSLKIYCPKLACGEEFHILLINIIFFNLLDWGGIYSSFLPFFFRLDSPEAALYYKCLSF